MSDEPEFLNDCGRRTDRYAFAAEVQFRSGSKRAAVQVRDISTHGARVSGVFLVHEGDPISLKLPSLEAIPARVVWARSFEFGCEFERPLSPVVLATISAKAG